MEIIVEGLSKRYGRQWIFKNLNHHFKSGSRSAIIGHNGSGKSTLTKLLSGIESPSKGSISFGRNSLDIPVHAIAGHIQFVSPYQELIEELTLKEHLDFHMKMKGGRTEPATALFESLQLPFSKPIRYFSSGMKQRVKLGLAFTSNASMLLLDEPTTNLDSTGVSWYQEQISNLNKDATIIVSSNQPQEYDFCTDQITISDYSK